MPSARRRARGLADEMPVRQRRQVCIGGREPARPWRLRASQSCRWLPLRAERGSLSDTAGWATKQTSCVIHEGPGVVKDPGVVR